MPTEYRLPIRLSKQRIRSNPVLESHRVYQQGSSLRDRENRQLERLLELQREGISVHCVPDFKRIDGSELMISDQRIGVVGLLVDNSGVGLVTQINASPHSGWEVSIDLPFRQAHIQSLLLRLLGESGVDEGLPELLAFRISDTLSERCEGDSMDIAGLLAIVDAVNGSDNELFNAVASVVSPVEENELEPSKSVAIKLDAFEREFGRGSLLVRFENDLEAMKYDDSFDLVWAIRSLRDLAHKLSEAGLIQCLNRQFTLASEHGLAISSQMHRLLASETTYLQASKFIQRVRGRIAADTPLRTKLEISYAEEDLHRHTGNFDEAIAVRRARVELENNSLISCYERMADSDNRHAAALYDAHRFSEAIQCLEPWLERLRYDPKICLPETRSFLFNTLGRCLVAVCDPRWEEMFDASLRIQQAVSPANVPRTENSLIHGYLKCNRLSDAATYLDKRIDRRDDFRIWLRTEYARQNQSALREVDEQHVHKIDPKQHVFGFAMQAIARHAGQSLPTRIEYLRLARDCFFHQIDSNKSNVKLFFGICCNLAIAVASKNDEAFMHSIAEFEAFCKRPGLNAFWTWYEPSIRQLESQPNWDSIEDLFSRIPHL